MNPNPNPKPNPHQAHPPALLRAPDARRGAPNPTHPNPEPNLNPKPKPKPNPEPNPNPNPNPNPIPNQVLAALFLANDVYGMLQGPQSSKIAHSAHLGGALFGAVWVGLRLFLR